MSTANEQIQRMQNLFGDNWGRFAGQWVGTALRTAPIEPAEIVPAIEDIYRLAGFEKPRVIIVPSPGVLAFAGTFAAEIWARRNTNPTFDPASSIADVLTIPASCKAIASATLRALQAATALPPHHHPVRNPNCEVSRPVFEATYSPADIATVNALDLKIWRKIRDAVAEMEALNYWNECIRDAMRDSFGNPMPTEMMVKAAQEWAQPLAVALFGDTPDAQRAIHEAANWWQHSQAGNNWLYDTVCIIAARDLFGLNLPEHRNFRVWELCSVNGGYRYLHPEFCLVSDFPQMMDEASMDYPTQVQSKSLEERYAAPVIRWRDGWLV
ncbi:MAG: hypothetical protein JSR83_01195 [Proteobacteria bacterium]|nr:hypothetical protein [Pseudomonadota bacterium]